MRFSRLSSFLVVCGSALLLLAASVDARGSRNNNRNNNSNNSRGGRYRLIDDEADPRKKREEERKKKEEETQRKKEEQQKKKEEAARKKAEAKQKQQEAQRKAAEQAKPRAEAKKKAKGGEKAVAKKDDKSDEGAGKLYEEAEGQFEEGQLLPGVALLRQCMEEFEGTEAAKQAEARLNQLLGMEPHGAMILHGEAEELFAGQRYRRALNKYNELLAQWPNSEQAAEAKKRVAEIREGDLLSKTVYSDEELKDARFWLLVGNIHHENARGGEASSAWRKVVEDYPGSPYAKHAEAKLAAVRGS